VVSINNNQSSVSTKPKFIGHDPEAHRIIISVGTQRIAFDFKTQITRLDPATGDAPAPVVRFGKPKGKRKLDSRH